MTDADLMDPAAQPPLPTRLPPEYDDDGQPLPPRFGGSWRREDDGSFSPRDEATARGAGLAWPG